MMIYQVLKKYICLLTSPLFHTLQHEIINLIYLVIYIYSIYIKNQYMNYSYIT